MRRGPGPAVKRFAPYLALLGTVVILDQITKALLVRALPLHEYVPLIDGFLSLSHVHNRGAAFGVLSDARLPYQPLLLSALSLTALLAIAYYFVRLPPSARLPRLALALVLGGAVGNLIDRLLYGHVVDFVDMGIGDLRWYAWNVADAAVSLGILTLFAAALLGDRAPGRRPASTPA